MSGGSRVSIPGGLRRRIQNIKEITGNHSDEEVHAMLKECGMDPNETTQKPLLQDTFHEVKRKRDKKEEISRELADSRRRSGMTRRGGRSARGGYPSRFLSNDTGGGRINSVGKESGVTQGTNKGNASSSSLPTPNAENKISTSISRKNSLYKGIKKRKLSRFRLAPVIQQYQQSEGSGVWIPATGRDISVMPVNSFYGLSPQAQHLAFTPLLQQSHAMAGAVKCPAGPYQQPQRAQMNWANNY